MEWCSGGSRRGSRESRARIERSSGWLSSEVVAASVGGVVGSEGGLLVAVVVAVVVVVVRYDGSRDVR